MRKSFLLLSIYLLLLLSGVGLSQTAESNSSAHEEINPNIPIKIDEFGRVGDCELGARLDNLFITLNNNPNAVGYVILYSGVDMLPSERESHPMLARINQNIAFRKYDASRIVFVKGGFRQNIGTELFLVHPKALPPTPTDIIAAPPLPTGTFLWGGSWLNTEDVMGEMEKYVLASVRAKQEEEARLEEINSQIEAVSPEDQSENRSDPINGANNQEDESEDVKLTPEEEESARFSWIKEKFGAELVKRKGSRGVMIFYVDDEYYDIEKIKRFVNEGRDRIALSAKIPSSKISVIFGGYGDNEVEYHIVSKGSRNPIPQPKERPIDIPEN